MPKHPFEMKVDTPYGVARVEIAKNRTSTRLTYSLDGQKPTREYFDGPYQAAIAASQKLEKLVPANTFFSQRKQMYRWVND